MSFRLRAAIVAAFALSAAAAMSASEMSIAGESIASVTSLPKTVPAATQPAVVFAAPRETAQPLDSDHVAGSSSSSDSDFSATSLAALVDAQGAPEELDGDMQCLAGAVYFESKGESLEGQLSAQPVQLRAPRIDAADPHGKPQLAPGRRHCANRDGGQLGQSG